MAILFKNNAASTLDYMHQAPDKDFVDIYVVDPTVFPTIASGSDDYFYLTLVGENALEIVKVFAQIPNVNTGKLAFRSYRAQEGTTAQEWTKGTRIEMRITAEALESFVPTAVQLAQDNLDAVGVASTTNVGFAGVDGKTTQADAGGVITAKDVAIGGDLGDLASKRGQIGTPPIQIFTKTSADDAAALNLNDDKWWVNGEYSLSLRGEVFSFTPVVNNTPLEVSNNYSARLRVANVYHTGNGIQEFSIAIGGKTIRTYYRTRFFNSDNTFSYYPWREAILTSNLGDGIRVTNGIISVPEYEGATASTSGTSGLVPPATAGQQESFLTGGGEYKPALTKISDSVSLKDSTTAASAKAVKTAYDLASAALPKSGGTISGNISVVGGITVAAPDGESEGGQILLKNGTDGSYPVVIDTTNNQIRFFGGPGDIVHVDLETGKFVGNLTGKADSAHLADNTYSLAGRPWLESLCTDSPGWVIGSVDEQLRPINTGSLKVLAADRIISGSFAYGRASDGFYLPNGGSWFVFCILDNDVSHGSVNAMPLMAAGGSHITWSFNGTGYTWIGIKVL